MRVSTLEIVSPAARGLASTPRPNLLSIMAKPKAAFAEETDEFSQHKDHRESKSMSDLIEDFRTKLVLQPPAISQPSIVAAASNNEMEDKGKALQKTPEIIRTMERTGAITQQSKPTHTEKAQEEKEEIETMPIHCKNHLLFAIRREREGRGGL